MSIRLRLTLLYCTILAVALVVFSTLLYATQTRSTYDNIKTNLVRQATVLARGEERFPGPRDGPPAPGPSSPEVRPGLGVPNGTLPGRWTQIRTITGTVLGQSFDLNGTSLPLSQNGLQKVQNGSGWFETAEVEDQPLLIYSQPFTARGGSVQILQLAFPIAQPQHSLDTLRLMLLTGSGVAILAAFAVGWVLAGTALRPIHRITHTAQAIGAEHNFSRRVDHKGPADEVGQLATTFNDMLAELESAYRQLEGSLDSQRRFVADASHELRTPLTTVRGNVELLRRQPPMDPKEREEILADTTDEVDRLIRLVNQLLVLARADAGQRLALERLAVKPLLEDVHRQAKPHAGGTTALCGPIPDITVLGNRDALKQVLLILLDNAQMHTAPGTTVELSTASVDGHAVIRVRDTGPGISPDVLPHIFERFYRGTVSRSGPGIGLGLSIARELVEAQDGTIEVESQVGQGTVFTVTLPQAES